MSVGILGSDIETVRDVARFLARPHRACRSENAEAEKKTEQPFHRGARTSLVKAGCQPNHPVTVSNATQLNTVLTEGVAWAAGTLRMPLRRNARALIKPKSNAAMGYHHRDFASSRRGSARLLLVGDKPNLSPTWQRKDTPPRAGWSLLSKLARYSLRLAPSPQSRYGGLLRARCYSCDPVRGS